MVNFKNLAIITIIQHTMTKIIILEKPYNRLTSSTIPIKNPNVPKLELKQLGLNLMN